MRNGRRLPCRRLRLLLRRFPEYAWINTRGEGNLSRDGRWYAFAGQTYDSTVHFRDLVVFDILNNRIDLYVEYTGTALGVYNKITDKFPSAEAAYQKIKEVDGAKGIVWLNMSAVNNTYGFAMNRDDAQKRGIVSMSDLAKAVNGGAKLTFASNAEFYARPDGLPGWQKAYGFEFDRDNVKRMDTGLTYSALKDRQVDTAVVFATDGRIPAFNFVVLKDDKHYAPWYNLTPVVRKEILDKYPKIAEPLNALSAKLNDETMAKLNASVDVDKKTVEDVAHDFLKSSGLI